jgi:serine/threonine-protein kinase SRPK3
MGPFPRNVALSGKYSSEIFNRKGEVGFSLIPRVRGVATCIYAKCNLVRGQLRHISKLKYWNAASVLKEKYLIPDEDAETLCSFLEPMLNVTPELRATAAGMVRHPWLEGVRVVGEEAVEAMDEADEKEKQNSVGADGKGKELEKPRTSREQALANAKAVDPALVDALKPAETSAVTPSASPPPPQPPGSPASGKAAVDQQQANSITGKDSSPAKPKKSALGLS